jgi:hypothetical protein
MKHCNCQETLAHMDKLIQSNKELRGALEDIRDSLKYDAYPEYKDKRMLGLVKQADQALTNAAKLEEEK